MAGVVAGVISAGIAVADFITKHFHPGLFFYNDTDFPVWYTVYFDGVQNARAQKEYGWCGPKGYVKLSHMYAAGSSYYLRCEVKSKEVKVKLVAETWVLESGPKEDSGVFDTIGRFGCDTEITPRTLKTNDQKSFWLE